MFTTTGGLRKAAILLVQLGRDQAAKVLAKLPEPVVEELTAEIVRMRDVSWEDAEAVVGEAHTALLSDAVAGRGGMELAKQLLARSVGAERAEEIMDRLGATLADMPFEAMRRADARQLITFLADEHPQTIALVLAHLGPAQSAIVLSGFPQKLQADVAHRIARMEQASPDVIRLVERELDRRMSTVLGPQELSTVGGVPPLVAIINRADRSTERMILEGLEQVSVELAEQVRAQMFIFEDITTLDDSAIQLVLRNVESNDLALALKGTSALVREKIMKNLSTRAAENLAEEIELLGPRRISEVEEAQVKVVTRDPRPGAGRQARHHPGRRRCVRQLTPRSGRRGSTGRSQASRPPGSVPGGATPPSTPNSPRPSSTDAGRAWPRGTPSAGPRDAALPRSARPSRPRRAPRRPRPSAASSDSAPRSRWRPWPTPSGTARRR